MLTIPLLRDDPHFVVVNKPTGWLSQSTWGVPSVQTMLRERWPAPAAAPNQASPAWLELPHRLDRGTSGCLIFTKTKLALSSLGQQFQAQRVAKGYLAVARGSIGPDEGVLEDWIRKVPDEARGELVDASEPGAKRARLSYRTLEVRDGTSLLAITLETGRMHQIRLQLAARGCSVLGDTVYGDGGVWVSDETCAAPGSEHFALHAAWVEFHHPKTAERSRVIADCPDAWQAHFGDAFRPSEWLNIGWPAASS